MASFRSLLRQVLHLQESPERTALAFAIGVAIAFCPFYGLHMILVGICTWALRLNFVALLAGAFVNNPWTLVPILGGTYWTGAILLHRTDLPTFAWHDVSFRGIYDQVMPYAMPFLLGGLVLSVIGALLSYPIALYVIGKYRRAHAGPVPQPLPPGDSLR